MRGSTSVRANLAWLAFMLGFTSWLAVSRFGVRRGPIIDEANAIGTTSLRGRQLPEPHRMEVRTMILRVLSYDTEARREARRCVGRSDRRAQRSGQVTLNRRLHAQSANR
jgi:hypothetical protein